MPSAHFKLVTQINSYYLSVLFWSRSPWKKLHVEILRGFLSGKSLIFPPPPSRYMLGGGHWRKEMFFYKGWKLSTEFYRYFTEQNRLFCLFVTGKWRFSDNFVKWSAYSKFCSARSHRHLVSDSPCHAFVCEGLTRARDDSVRQLNHACVSMNWNRFGNFDMGASIFCLGRDELTVIALDFIVVFFENRKIMWEDVGEKFVAFCCKVWSKDQGQYKIFSF
jgi:hypothetical protein